MQTMDLSEDVSELCTREFENVFIYVGDAVRWDYTPAEIEDMGATIKTVAASTHSPTSFASLVSGQHPSSHLVYTFSNALPPESFTIFDLDGYNTRFVNSIFHHGERHHELATDPIYSVLDIQQPENRNPVLSIEEPFITMERGPGGHAPYGSFEGTGREYFREHGDESKEGISDDYQGAIEKDVNLFTKRLAQLDEREVLDRTLVVYTSDHGELLGEGGMLGHNSPILPELVYVPTVFIHPAIESVEIDSNGFCHADLVPTILRCVGKYDRYDPMLDGSLLGTRSRSDFCPSYYKNVYDFDFIFKTSMSFEYESVWDQNGGYVFPKTGTLQRLIVLFGQMTLGPKGKYLRNHASAALKSYIKGSREFGSPGFSADEAIAYLESLETEDQESKERALSEESKERLEDLGYI